MTTQGYKELVWGWARLGMLVYSAVVLTLATGGQVEMSEGAWTIALVLAIPGFVVAMYELAVAMAGVLLAAVLVRVVTGIVARSSYGRRLDD